MSVSDKPIVGIVIAVVILGAAAWIVMRSGGSEGLEKAYYYDVDAQKLIVDDVNKVPPFKTSSGGTAVVAAVFSCGDCGDASTHFVGYLEKLTDALRTAMDTGDAIDPDVAKVGHVVREESGSDWVPSSTMAGQQIIEAVGKECGDQKPTACQP